MLKWAVSGKPAEFRRRFTVSWNLKFWRQNSLFFNSLKSLNFDVNFSAIKRRKLIFRAKITKKNNFCFRVKWSEIWIFAPKIMIEISHFFVKVFRYNLNFCAKILIFCLLFRMTNPDEDNLYVRKNPFCCFYPQKSFRFRKLVTEVLLCEASLDRIKCLCLTSSQKPLNCFWVL